MSSGVLARTLAAAVNAAVTDGEFGRAARGWNGSVRIAVSDTGAQWTVLVIDGQPRIGDSGAPDVVLSAPMALWLAMLDPAPRPFLQDISGARLHGLTISGDPLVQAQRWAALNRLVHLSRGAAPNPIPQPGRAGRDDVSPAWDRSVGRYLHVALGPDSTDHRLYIEQSGPDDGIPLLLQHTAGADGRQWRHVLEDAELAKRFRMLAYDLPFHGKSVPPTGVAWWAQPYRLTTASAMAVPLAIIDALGLVRPVFMGSSIGGHLAVDLAVHHPGRFRAVVGLEAAIKQRPTDTSLLDHPGVTDDYKGALMYGLMAPSAPDAFRHETAFVYSQGAPFVFAGDLHYWSVDHDLTRDGGPLDVGSTAVYLLTGEYDWATPPPMSAALADRIPGATFAVLEGLGHFPMSEDPERFLAAIRPLLMGIALR